MNFKDYVGGNKQDIYSKMMEYLPMKEPAEHYAMAKEYAERRGNYRRPGLLMLAGEMLGASKEKLLLSAAAMQMSEDWILIHDDVEDDSELRRGKPALHKIYGKELAINAGDAVHIVMWKMLKDNLQVLGPELGGKIYDKFYDMLEYTVEGQYVETNFIYRTRSLAKATEELYFRIVQAKTCYYSVYGPMQIGSMIAGADLSTLGIMKDIGEPAGMAFQIVDDILDMTADEKDFGKKRYGDLYEGKLTLIMLHTYSKADTQEKARIDAIYLKNRDQKTADDINFLVEMVGKYGGIEYARSVAEEYSAKAAKTIESYKGIIPDNEYTATLISAIEELYNRKK